MEKKTEAPESVFAKILFGIVLIILVVGTSQILFVGIPATLDFIDKMFVSEEEMREELDRFKCEKIDNGVYIIDQWGWSYCDKTQPLELNRIGFEDSLVEGTLVVEDYDIKTICNGQFGAYGLNEGGIFGCIVYETSEFYPLKK